MMIHTATGELLRHLTITPNRHYHGTGKPVGGGEARGYAGATMRSGRRVTTTYSSSGQLVAKFCVQEWSLDSSMIRR